MFVKLLLLWTRFVIHNVKTVMAIMSIATVLALFYSIENFSINSDTEELIKQDTQWKKIHTEWAEAFPHMTHITFVVLTGESVTRVNAVSKELESILNTNSEYFESVFAPNNLDFLDKHAFLYLEEDKLDELITQLAQAQPLLTALRVDPNLRGIFKLLGEALDSEETLTEGFEKIVNVLTMTAKKMNRGVEHPVSWRDQLFSDDSEGSDNYYNIIFVKGKANFGESLPNAQILSSIRESIKKIDHPEKDEVTIRLTGQTPLDHGEISSAMESAQFAGAIAMVLLIVVLVFGVKSLRVILATYLSMLVGLIWTTAYALIAVGQFNTISIIFLVMFIGLGVDFAIHLCLRYQESLSHYTKNEAIEFTSADMGSAITLCAISSALGFLAFVPTNYTGLAELGIISGGGMFIALIVSLTLIPAFFAWVKEPLPLTPQPGIASFSSTISQHRFPIIITTLIISAVATFIAKDAYFDYSTLALKDQESEAMKTFYELQENNAVTAFSISYVAKSPEDAIDVKSRLQKLDVVSEVITAADYVPANQPEKLLILEDADLILGSTFYATTNKAPFSKENRAQLTRELLDSIDSTLVSQNQSDSVLASLKELRQQLSLLILHEKAPDRLLTYETMVVGDMEEQIEWLEQALKVSEVDLKDLPPELYSRFFAEDGRQLVSVLPVGDISVLEVLEEFVNQVRDVTGKATGRPIAELGIGEIVLSSFKEAVIYAIICIALVLIFSLKSFTDTALVFIPLFLTTILTLATSVLVDLPINMANVVVIPLIFGLGVDNGIHVVKRFHQSQTLHDLIISSTPRAVLLSTLTTLGTFGALSFSSHQGIYSIGVLLTCALSYQLVLTLIVLPALLSVFSKPRTESVA